MAVVNTLVLCSLSKLPNLHTRFNLLLWYVKHYQRRLQIYTHIPNIHLHELNRHSYPIQPPIITCSVCVCVNAGAVSSQVWALRCVCLFVYLMILTSSLMLTWSGTRNLVLSKTGSCFSPLYLSMITCSSHRTQHTLRQWYTYCSVCHFNLS